MSSELAKLVRRDDIAAEDDGFTVTLGARSQRVYVARRGESWRFTSRILGRRRVEDFGWSELAHIIWHHNRHTPLVAFELDERRRLIGAIEQPAATLDRTELETYLLLLARACDRLEQLLTGRDEF